MDFGEQRIDRRGAQRAGAKCSSSTLGETGSKDKRKEGQKMTPRTAVLYARVSSREQREEGYSIEAQVKLLRAAL